MLPNSREMKTHYINSNKPVVHLVSLTANPTFPREQGFSELHVLLLLLQADILEDGEHHHLPHPQEIQPSVLEPGTSSRVMKRNSELSPKCIFRNS